MIPAHNNQSVPSPVTFGRPISTLQVWRLKDHDTRLRVACSLGDLSIWEEGTTERELFRINLGVLKEISRRAEHAVMRASRERLGQASDLAPLAESTVARIWREVSADPETRFSYSATMTPSGVGGWRKCLELAGKILQARGQGVPWRSPEFLEWECQ
jgi:hypothetical protein